MKNLFKILTAAALAVAGLVATAKADTISFGGAAANGFCTSSPSNVTALAWAVVSARSGNNGVPVVTFLDYGTDLANAVIRTYKINAQCTCNFTNSTVTIPVNTTNGFNPAGSAVIVVRHRLTDDYEKLILTTSTGSTNLVTTQAAKETVVPGDLIYQAVLTPSTAGVAASGGCPGSITTSGLATTNNLAAPGGIFVGQQGLPLLIEITGTSAASLYSVSGYYMQPVSAGHVTPYLGPP